ncbi:hypothetical protein NIES4071_76000 [Calothrix sp. NIES-4071]|nr:hypothetical protein NIES4071_76000 [Calothrix sp. NIES-4071]BAZ61875.1 hypothetical protein NIES4105_75950 [Calothrix sp. NIES-4105]
MEIHPSNGAVNLPLWVSITANKASNNADLMVKRPNLIT